MFRNELVIQLFADQSEGVFTDPMRQEQNQAARWVATKSDENAKKATAAASGLLRSMFLDMSNLPLLADRVRLEQ